MRAETYNSTTEDVLCPHCGFSNQLTDLYSDLRGPEDAETVCSECENPFRAVFHVSISVWATAMEG